MLLELTLKWGGETVKVKPTMELLCGIEEDNLSLPILAAKLSNGDFPIAQCSKVITHFLNYGGISVSHEEVYFEILGAEPEVFIELMGHIFDSVSPKTKVAKPLKKKPVKKK